MLLGVNSDLVNVSALVKILSFSNNISNKRGNT